VTPQDLRDLRMRELGHDVRVKKSEWRTEINQIFPKRSERIAG
jgi:hypothetical protein